jgi:hypothetical protein
MGISEMSECEFSKESLEHFENEAKELAIRKAELMWPYDCKEKREYIENKWREIYYSKIGERI